MSHLTQDTLAVFTPIYYDENRNFLYEGPDYYHEDSAIEEAQEYIAKHVEGTGEYIFAVIERQVCPIYR